MLTQFQVLTHALKVNGPLQLFFYLSNLDADRFVEYSKAVEYLDNEEVRIALDLGAGYSVFPSFLEAKSLKRTIYVTLDLSLNACKHQAENKDANIHPILGDMRYLPIRSSLVDAIIAISSIEHVGTQKRIEDVSVFKEIKRVMREDGCAIVSLPYSSTGPKFEKIVHSRFLLSMLQRLRNLWLALLGKHFYYFVEQTSIDSFQKRYDDNEITRVLRESGLSDEKRFYWGKRMFAAFFSHVPFGWFVLKDLLFGLVLSKLDDIFWGSSTNAIAIMLKVIKD